MPESNLALLERALRLAAEDLVARSPLQPGARIAIRRDGDEPVDHDIELAFLAALTQIQIEAWPLTPLESSRLDALPLDAAGDGDTGESADIPADLEAARQAQERLQAMGLDAPDSVLAQPSAGAGVPSSRERQRRVEEHLNLPLLAFYVEEARVDYPRLFRAGVFGGQHVERRAIGRVSARLLRPETRAVYWVGVADTAYSDVVPRSDLKVLEDSKRPETTGTVPTQNWTKVAEPALVVGLVAGLVALFYTNRP